MVKSKTHSLTFIITESTNLHFLLENRTFFQSQWAETHTRHVYIVMWHIINNEFLFVHSRSEGTESEIPGSAYWAARESTLLLNCPTFRVQSITPAICSSAIHVIWERENCCFELNFLIWHEIKCMAEKNKNGVCV